LVEGPLAIIQCDIRRGRTDDQKRRLAAGLTSAVSEATGESTEQIFLVIREMPGFNFVDAGEHVAEYVAGPDGGDVAGSAQLRARGKI
jgi:4-oxalocrotonate tautomerase family enzyme